MSSTPTLISTKTLFYGFALFSREVQNVSEGADATGNLSFQKAVNLLYARLGCDVVFGNVTWKGNRLNGCVHHAVVMAKLHISMYMVGRLGQRMGFKMAIKSAA